MKIGVCGGGIGGLCAAIALRQFGHEPIVFEAAAQFRRVGAGINLAPNAVHVLDRLGVSGALRQTASRPTFRISRMWDSGEETSRLPMSDAAEQKYDAPQLTLHRADLLAALRDRIPPDSLNLGRRVSGFINNGDETAICFAAGVREQVDVIVGADGIHSAVRAAMFGNDHPTPTGMMSHRAVYSRDLAKDVADLDAFTKWWGPTPDRQIITFPLAGGREVFVFATTPDDADSEEGWLVMGDANELRATYSDFHPQAQALLAPCCELNTSALLVREPMPQWSIHHATLLGDAAHAMVPFMAQGAGMAIEDAAVLARVLEGANRHSVPEALRRYEQTRLGRTAEIQRQSFANEWLKKPENADWVYGYHAWEVDLSA